MHDAEVMREAAALWRKCLTLSKEMLKFIDKQDIDTFLALVPQFEGLAEKIRALPANNYRETEECQAIIREMKPLDMQIAYKARAWLNKSRRQTSVVKAYDLTGFRSAGTLLNRRY